MDLLAIRVRATLVGVRTALVNAARGLAKAQGSRLPSCDADSMGVKQMEGLPEPLSARLRPLLEQVESLTEKIKELGPQHSGADRPDAVSGDQTPCSK